MIKSMFYTLILASFAGSAAYAHHPAADRVDPEIYSMIDENVADTPHADMTFDDMGGVMEAREDMGESASEMRGDEEAREEMRDNANEARGDAAFDREMAVETEANREAADDMREAIDTMGLLDEVTSALAD